MQVQLWKVLFAEKLKGRCIFFLTIVIFSVCCLSVTCLKDFSSVPLQHAATMEGLLKRSNYQERGFVLTRAFFAGSQRTGQCLFS